MTVRLVLASIFVGFLLLGSMGQAQDALTNRYLLDRATHSRAFEFLLADDLKSAFVQTGDRFQPFWLTSDTLRSSLRVRVFQDPKTKRRLFFSSDQRIPPELARTPELPYTFDAAWDGPDGLSLIVTGHPIKDKEPQNDCLAVVLLDWRAQGSVPLSGFEIHLENRYGLEAVAARLFKGTIRVWVLGPGDDITGDLREYTFSPTVGKPQLTKQMVVSEMRMTLYCPESGRWCDNNNELHMVTFGTVGSSAVDAVRAPKNGAGIAITQKGILEVAIDAQGTPKQVFRLSGLNWISVGNLSIVALDGSGKNALVRDLKTGRIYLAQL